jgi:cytochrome c
MPRGRRLQGLLFVWAAAALVAAMATSACVPGRDPVEPMAIRGDPERGRRLLSQYQCGACHTIPGVPASRGQVASSLVGFGQRSYIAGRLPNRAELLAQWIAHPQALVPGTAMPSMGVTPEDARHMAAYLMELR